MFLPEIFMHLQHLAAAARDAPAERQATTRESIEPTEARRLAAAPSSAPLALPTEWDDWKSVRDVA
jgi:hypothetical protein